MTTLLNDSTVLTLPITMGKIPIEDNIKLYYKRMGGGDKIAIVLHGGPGFNSNYMALDLRQLSHGRTLIFYDQRGSGYSTPITDPELISIEHFVEDLEKVRLFFHLDKLTLIGHSWGALLAGLYATSYPDNVEKMVLIGAAGPNSDSDKEFEERLPKGVPDKEKDALKTIGQNYGEELSLKRCWDSWSIWLKAFNIDGVNTRRIWGDICNISTEYYKGTHVSVIQFMHDNYLRENQPDIRDELNKVKAPTLVIHGEEDPIPIDAAHAWVKSLPNAKLFKFPTSGHLPWVDSPDLFFPAVDTFLRGDWPNTFDESGNKDKNIKATPLIENQLPYETLFNEIKERSEEFALAISDQKWNRASEYFTKDGMTLPPAAPPISGQNGIATFWKTAYKKGMRSLELQTIEVEGMGVRTMEIGKYVIRGEKDEILDTGKYMVIWKKTEDGWKLYRDIFNTSLETRSPFEVPDYLFPPEGTLEPKNVKG